MSIDAFGEPISSELKAICLCRSSRYGVGVGVVRGSASVCMRSGRVCRQQEIDLTSHFRTLKSETALEIDLTFGSDFGFGLSSTQQPWPTASSAPYCLSHSLAVSATILSCRMYYTIGGWFRGLNPPQSRDSLHRRRRQTSRVAATTPNDCASPPT